MTPVPFANRSMFIVPMRAEGETKSGIWIEHHAKIPPIYGRVTAVHPSCRFTAVGDWVLYLPNRPVRLAYRGGVVYSLDERQVLGVVEAGDGRPWFAA